MKKRKPFIIILISIAVFTVAISLFIFKTAGVNTNIHRNFGISNTEINVVDMDGNINTAGIDVNKVVPDKDKLISNLKKAGYTVNQYDTVYDTGISAERIHAVKNKSAIDICYGLSEGDSQKVFNYFENNKYHEAYVKHEFYLMALNGNFVYFISDKRTFKDAGFTSLTNSGIQYICE